MTFEDNNENTENIKQIDKKIMITHQYQLLNRIIGKYIIPGCSMERQKVEIMQ